MIRILIIATAFLTVTVGLLMLQPDNGSTRRAALPLSGETANVPAQVSRAETDLVELIPVTQPQPQATATLPSDRLGQAVELAATRPATPVETPTAATSTAAEEDLRQLTAGVLAGLGATTAKAPADDMQLMTATVLANLTAATAPRPDAPASLETLVVQAMRQGQSDAYLDALLNEAAGAGQISVPKSLVTSTGKVDTATLLATLVSRSQPQAAAPQIIAGGDGVEVRVVQRAGRTVQYNFYTVQSGDSLGAIAHKFYGDAGLYSEIFEANRQFLSSPDRIRVGQRLSIPALNAT